GLGRWAVWIVESLGRFGTFFIQALSATVTPPYRLWPLVGRINYIGFRSLLIILLTGTFTGMVLGLQIFFPPSRFGSDAFRGPARRRRRTPELGPVPPALGAPGRPGPALPAELGIMRIPEQIDALTVMALSPMRSLVAPSMLAGVIPFPLMTAMFDVIGIFGG